MNSEELEVSLRTEFESYLKNIFADVRQEISQIQEKIETELENHKAQLETVFKDAMSRVEQDRSLDESFRESMVEHFRQAKDEGARITATAIAEAEELAKQNAPVGGVKEIFEAVNDISTKLTQAEILKTLVQHAGQFTPRGAFFIIKNEHFVGWRTFGSEKGESDEAVREVFMPFSSDSILSEATRSLAAVESSYGTYSDDAGILEKLGYEGSPDKMYAIPLVVRGRAVAVLYADYGTKGAEVNAEALETLVRVASLTVELLASARGAAAPKEVKKKPAQSFVGGSAVAATAAEPKESAQPEYATIPKYTAPVAEHNFKPSYESESFNQSSYEDRSTTTKDYSFDSYQPQPQIVEEPSSYAAPQHQPEETPEEPVQENSSAHESQSWSSAPGESVTEVSADDYAAEINADDYSTQSFSTDYAVTQDYSTQNNVNEYTQNETVETNDTQNFSFQMPVVEPAVSPKESEPVKDYQFDANQSSYEAPVSSSYESFSMPVPPQQQQAPESYMPPPAPPVSEQKYGSFEMPQAQPPVVEPPKAAEASFAQPAAEPIQQAGSVSSVKSRFSERNVDLPIEVSEDERRLHNDARRFARLLVSEIKLYNEQKVKEGREAGDLYDRLREAVDRSREMYDKRVQPMVAAKFDYFHYELVNTLAEGDETRLGSDYPGASV